VRHYYARLQRHAAGQQRTLVDVYPIPLFCNCGRVIACDETVNKMSDFQKPNDATVANG
jgi:hypothetical protein